MPQADHASITEGSRSAIPASGPFTAIERAHAALVAIILNEKPAPICFGWASPGEIEDRAEHVGRIMQAMRTYIVACTEEAADNSGCGDIDYNHHNDVLGDIASDITGELARCAHDMCETSDFERAYGRRR